MLVGRDTYWGPSTLASEPALFKQLGNFSRSWGWGEGVTYKSLECLGGRKCGGNSKVTGSLHPPAPGNKLTVRPSTQFSFFFHFVGSPTTTFFHRGPQNTQTNQGSMLNMNKEK